MFVLRIQLVHQRCDHLRLAGRAPPVQDRQLSLLRVDYPQILGPVLPLERHLHHLRRLPEGEDGDDMRLQLHPIAGMGAHIQFQPHLGTQVHGRARLFPKSLPARPVRKAGEYQPRPLHPAGLDRRLGRAREQAPEAEADQVRQGVDEFIGEGGLRFVPVQGDSAAQIHRESARALLVFLHRRREKLTLAHLAQRSVPPAQVGKQAAHRGQLVPPVENRQREVGEEKQPEQSGRQADNEHLPQPLEQGAAGRFGQGLQISIFLHRGELSPQAGEGGRAGQIIGSQLLGLQAFAGVHHPQAGLTGGDVEAEGAGVFVLLPFLLLGGRRRCRQSERAAGKLILPHANGVFRVRNIHQENAPRAIRDEGVAVEEVDAERCAGRLQPVHLLRQQGPGDIQHQQAVHPARQVSVRAGYSHAADILPRIKYAGALRGARILHFNDLQAARPVGDIGVIPRQRQRLGVPRGIVTPDELALLGIAEIHNLQPGFPGGDKGEGLSGVHILGHARGIHSAEPDRALRAGNVHNLQALPPTGDQRELIMQGQAAPSSGQRHETGLPGPVRVGKLQHPETQMPVCGIGEAFTQLYVRHGGRGIGKTNRLRFTGIRVVHHPDAPFVVGHEGPLPVERQGGCQTGRIIGPQRARPGRIFDREDSQAVQPGGDQADLAGQAHIPGVFQLFLGRAGLLRVVRVGYINHAQPARAVGHVGVHSDVSLGAAPAPPLLHAHLDIHCAGLPRGIVDAKRDRVPGVGDLDHVQPGIPGSQIEVITLERHPQGGALHRQRPDLQRLPGFGDVNDAQAGAARSEVGQAGGSRALRHLHVVNFTGLAEVAELFQLLRWIGDVDNMQPAVAVGHVSQIAVHVHRGGEARGRQGVAVDRKSRVGQIERLEPIRPGRQEQVALPQVQVLHIRKRAGRPALDGFEHDPALHHRHPFQPIGDKDQVLHHSQAGGKAGGIVIVHRAQVIGKGQVHHAHAFTPIGDIGVPAADEDGRGLPRRVVFRQLFGGFRVSQIQQDEAPLSTGQVSPFPLEKDILHVLFTGVRGHFDRIARFRNVNDMQGAASVGQVEMLLVIDQPGGAAVNLQAGDAVGFFGVLDVVDLEAPAVCGNVGELFLDGDILRPALDINAPKLLGPGRVGQVQDDDSRSSQGDVGLLLDQAEPQGRAGGVEEAGLLRVRRIADIHNAETVGPGGEVNGVLHHLEAVGPFDGTGQPHINHQSSR